MPGFDFPGLRKDLDSLNCGGNCFHRGLGRNSDDGKDFGVRHDFESLVVLASGSFGGLGRYRRAGYELVWPNYTNCCGRSFRGCGN